MIITPKAREKDRSNQQLIGRRKAIDIGTITYYDPVKNWKKIKPHLTDRSLQEILVSDFNKFTFGRREEPFTFGQFPAEFESCDWYWNRKGRHPTYRRYVKYAACHRLVNFNLRLAILTEPDRPWRIISSDAHSTVFDGISQLFDFNFCALGIPPSEAFQLAYKKEFAPGRLLKTYLADHYTVDS
jgi:hypothetical protein